MEATFSSTTTRGYWNQARPWPGLLLCNPSDFPNGVSFRITFPPPLIVIARSLLTTSISLHTEPLLLRTVEPRDRNPFSVSIARPSKFLQLSLPQTRNRNGSIFKVHNSDFSCFKRFNCIMQKPQIQFQNDLQKKIDLSNRIFMLFRLNISFACLRYFKCAQFFVSVGAACLVKSVWYCFLLCQVLSAEKEQVHVVERSNVDELYDELVSRLLPSVLLSSNPNDKLLVGLAGPPGAGKSTLAHEVAKRINKIWLEKDSSFDSEVQLPDVAIVVPMDGFHLYRAELDAMENPNEAHARRGAPWTFNPLRLLTCLQNLRIHGSVYAPSFDHGVGDPVEDDIFVNIQHKVVIVEGNYLLLEDGVWKEISSLFDEKWQVLILPKPVFIDIDIDKAMQRVLKRHISTGKPPDIAKQRIENNDRLNAELIMKSKKNADIVIKSVDF
uniref:Uridine kinase C227.14 family n=1 Tax=Cajanus cajan TaxID=3821 RepID=A0A151SJ88_CAJCA|nr:Putative uridine kinase C227.14 family [Cajanus cajan]